MMNKFYNFIPKLIEAIEEYKPKKIVEIGTGLSTVIISKLYPEIELLSIEYNWFWYLLNKVIMILRGCRNAKLILRNPLKYNIPDADLYFLDSPIDYEDRKRILVKLDGKILLHDAKELGHKEDTVLIKTEKINLIHKNKK